MKTESYIISNLLAVISAAIGICMNSQVNAKRMAAVTRVSSILNAILIEPEFENA